MQVVFAMENIHQWLLQIIMSEQIMFYQLRISQSFSGLNINEFLKKSVH